MFTGGIVLTGIDLYSPSCSGNTCCTPSSPERETIMIEAIQAIIGAVADAIVGVFRALVGSLQG